MEIRVSKWSVLNGAEFYDIKVRICDASLSDTLTEEETHVLAVQFLQDTALHVRYESDIIPRLIELGILAEDMILDWYEDQKMNAAL